MSDLRNPSTTGSSASSLLGIYYDKVLLENLYPELKFYDIADKRPIPKNISTTITFTKMSKFSATVTDLTEGVPPSPTWLSSSQITAKISQLGAYTPISDVLTMSAIDPVVEDAARELGKQAGESVDKFIYYRCFGKKDATGGFAEATIGSTHTYDFSTFYDRAGSYAFSVSFFSQSGSEVAIAALKSFLTSASAATANQYGLNVDTVRRAVYKLKAANVPAFKDGSYVMVVHPDSALALERDEEFKDWASSQYADKMFNGEVGKVAGCRIVTSTNIAQAANSTLSVGTVLSGIFNVILAPKAIAVTEIDGHVHMKVKAAGSAGAVDPLDQVSTVGWKWTGAATVTDTQRGRIILTLKG